MQGFVGLFAQAPGQEIERVIAENIREAGWVALTLLILKFAVPALLVLLAVFTLFSWFIKGKIVTAVHPHEKGILEFRGRFSRIARSGFVWMFPFLHRLHKVSLQLQSVTIKETLRTEPKEGLFVTIHVSVYYQVTGAQAVLADLRAKGSENEGALFERALLAHHYSVEDLKELIANCAKDHLRTFVARKTLAEIFEEKDAISTDLNEHLSKILETYGTTVVRTPITDVSLSSDVVAASNRVLTAERSGEADVVTAKAKARVAVEEAMGEKTAAELIGQGEAARFGALGVGVQKTLTTLCGEPVNIEVAGAVATMLDLRRNQVLENFAHSGSGIILQALPPGTSDETMSVTAAILAAEAMDKGKNHFTGDELESRFEQALTNARKENNKELIELMEVQREHLRVAMAKIAESTGQALAIASRRVPIVGKRLAQGVKEVATKVSEGLS